MRHRDTVRTIVVLGLLGFTVLQGCECPGGGFGQARPEPAVTPETLDFGDVEVGSAKVLSFEVANGGTGRLEIVDTRVEGAPEGVFQLSDKKYTVTSGGRKTVEVTFTPFDEADYTATIFLETNSEETPTKEVHIVGRGFVPDVVVEPTQLDFGNVVVETVRTLSVQVSNNGSDRALVRIRPLTGSDVSQYRIVLPSQVENEQVLLEGGDAITIEVSYQPTVTGRHLAAFTVEPCDACQPINISLTGVGIESALVVEPPTLEFGAVNPGAEVTQSVHFRNVGNVQVQVTSLELSGIGPGQPPSPAFSIEDLPTPIVLDEGDEVEVPVHFAPQDLKSHLSNLLWRSNDSRNSEGTVTLVGQGGGPDVEVLPPELDFGPVAMGAPQERTVVVTNVGFDTLQISGYEIRGSGDFQLVDDPGAGQLAVGEIVQLTVRFDPTAEGDATAELVVHSNDTDEPEAVSLLRGTGLDLPPCTYEVAPPTLNFGAVERNKKRTLEFGITNANVSGECLVSVLSLTDDTDPEFTLPGGEVNGQLIAPGETFRVAIEFQPTRYGSFSGAVEFYISDPASPTRLVPLSG
ncbi:MAG: choice-of-anchor D domain-containing protein, partial [Deltaproteobacteria bacterium]